MLNKDLLLRTHPLIAAIVVVATIFVALLTLYGLTRWISQGEVMGRVEVAGVPVGGQPSDQLRTTLLDIEENHQTRPLRFMIDDHTVDVTGASTGLELDIDLLHDQVMAVGREGNGPYQFLWWLRHLFRTAHVDLIGYADPRALADLFNEWDTFVIGEPPVHGGIVVENGQLLPIYPAIGIGIDRQEASPIIVANALAAEPEPAALPTDEIVPRLTAEDIDDALAHAQDLVGESISLRYGEESVEFTPAMLTNAYLATTVISGSPQVLHSFDPEVIDTQLEPIRSEFEAEPVDAEFEITGDTIRIIPGSRGTRIDENETVQKLVQAGRTSSRIGLLPVLEDADPNVTTEELEALGIEHLVSSFTTYHEAGQDRVINIQLMADEVRGARLLPGSQFSLNSYVGERTEAKGYVDGGTLIGGELVDTVGGGVSQFATTMYNAVFWGGYEDIDHRPHSVWFNRYPEGIEATINWRVPDLVFRNNRSSAILIDTLYTPGSITVRIFGNNDGRTVRGEQRDGRTIINVINEGGPDAYHVEAELSERYDDTEPPAPRFEPDPDYRVDQRTTRQTERPGWSIDITRTISQGGEVVEVNEWTAVYRPQQGIYVVHPCRVPGQEHTCPTTTTLPPTTTTTTVPTPEPTPPPED